MQPEVKKLLLKKLRNNFFLMCAGILFLSAGWDKTGLQGYILVIGGLITTMAGFLPFMGLLLAWHELNKKAREEETGILEPDSFITRPAWLNRGVMFFIYILILIGIKFGASRHENDFGGLSFLFHSLIGGLVTGYAIFYLLALYFQSWNDHKNKRIEIAFYIILATVFLFVSLGPLINSYWAAAPGQCKNFVIDPSYRKHGTRDKYIRIITDHGTERFNPSYSFMRRLNPGDSLIILCIKKGALGYDFVDEFRIP